MLLLLAYSVTGFVVASAVVIWAAMHGHEPNPCGALLCGIVAGLMMVGALLLGG